MNKRYIITTGDPNGIGPEIILKAGSKKTLKECVVIGSEQVFNYYKNSLKIDVNWKSINSEKQDFDFTLFDIGYDIKIQPGKCTSDAGLFSIRCLDKAIEFLKSGEYKHVITAPLSKKAVSYHVPDFIGHTEYLAESFNTNNFSMMLANETFRVVLVTTHVSIKELPTLITKQNVRNAIINADNFLNSVSDDRGIAVCAFNPHAGESGLLGMEEIEVIEPVIKEFIEKGIKVEGPFPADTLFKTVFKKPYGIYIAMYHDQGLAPLKMIGKGKGVNITLGLPVFRISVDHGTAYDIADQGIADESSLIQAVEIAKNVDIN